MVEVMKNWPRHHISIHCYNYYSCWFILERCSRVKPMHGGRERCPQGLRRRGTGCACSPLASTLGSGQGHGKAPRANQVLVLEVVGALKWGIWKSLLTWKNLELKDCTDPGAALGTWPCTSWGSCSTSQACPGASGWCHQSVVPLPCSASHPLQMQGCSVPLGVIDKDTEKPQSQGRALRDTPCTGLVKDVHAQSRGVETIEFYNGLAWKGPLRLFFSTPLPQARWPPTRPGCSKSHPA